MQPLGWEVDEFQGTQSDGGDHIGVWSKLAILSTFVVTMSIQSAYIFELISVDRLISAFMVSNILRESSKDIERALSFLIQLELSF